MTGKISGVYRCGLAAIITKYWYYKLYIYSLRLCILPPFLINDCKFMHLLYNNDVLHDCIEFRVCYGCHWMLNLPLAKIGSGRFSADVLISMASFIYECFRRIFCVIFFINLPLPENGVVGVRDRYYLYFINNIPHLPPIYVKFYVRACTHTRIVSQKKW